jgi:hypothetical protein
MLELDSPGSVPYSLLDQDAHPPNTTITEKSEAKQKD